MLQFIGWFLFLTIIFPFFQKRSHVEYNLLALFCDCEQCHCASTLHSVQLILNSYSSDCEHNLIQLKADHRNDKFFGCLSRIFQESCIVDVSLIVDVSCMIWHRQFDCMCLVVVVLQDHMNTQLQFHGWVDHAEINLALIPVWCLKLVQPFVLRETGDSYRFVGKHFSHNVKPLSRSMQS